MADSKQTYLTGWGGHLSTEALPGALPVPQNAPQKVAYGLYAEQLSGTAFTCPRAANKRTWLYRIHPSVLHQPYELLEGEGRIRADFNDKSLHVTPNQLRWAPMPLPSPDKAVDFVDGLVTLAGSGDAASKHGIAIHMYGLNASMPHNRAMFNSDGDFLLVPQLGTLRLRTEMGVLDVPPGHIAVLPRGVKFAVGLLDDSGSDDKVKAARGYVLEVFNGHFELPELGPIGSNCLASPRDFEFPVAAYDPAAGSGDTSFELINKFQGRLFLAGGARSPFDVVAWHGNYAPFRYDLARFCTIGSVSFDHPDPSIFTVLTCRTDEPGVAAADFVIFPPRWMVQEDTFRPPYFHRNTMSEFMGMIYGRYDAKEGFLPGGASLHSAMAPHGPDAPTFQAASNADLKPVKFEAGLAFMFETTYMLKLTDYAVEAPHLEKSYFECWQKLPTLFDPSASAAAAAAK